MPLVIGALLPGAVPSPDDGLAGKPGTNGAAPRDRPSGPDHRGACFIGAAQPRFAEHRPRNARSTAPRTSPPGWFVRHLPVLQASIVLGVISGLQGLVLVVLAGLAGRQMPATGSLIKSQPLLEIALAIVLLSVASMALGLARLLDREHVPRRAMPLLVLLAIAQVHPVRRGCWPPQNGKVGLKPAVSWITPSRWGFASTRLHGQAERDLAPAAGLPDPVWDQQGQACGSWNMGLMVVLTLVFTLIAWRAPGRASARAPPEAALSRVRAVRGPGPGETIVEGDDTQVGRPRLPPPARRGVSGWI